MWCVHCVVHCLRAPLVALIGSAPVHRSFEQTGQFPPWTDGYAQHFLCRWSHRTPVQVWRDLSTGVATGRHPAELNGAAARATITPCAFSAGEPFVALEIFWRENRSVFLHISYFDICADRYLFSGGAHRCWSFRLLTGSRH